jgi:hypothetical protein
MGVARTALLLVALAASAAHAEIYAWRDATGTTRMSNIAPSWYSASEPSRVRTQVLVNGELVDDTGLPQAEREKLQARRAKAESLDKPGNPSPPSASASATGAATAAPLPPVPSKTPPPPVVPPLGGADAAKSATGLKRALEAQKLTDSMADQLKAASRPKQ